MADAPGLYKGADLQELSTAPLNSLLYLFELRSSVYSFANAKLRSTTSRVARTSLVCKIAQTDEPSPSSHD